jgi:hypothetical protein
VRILFSVVGLLVVVLIVGLLAKKQLQAVQPMAAGPAASADATVQSSAQAMQRQTADDVKKALDAGMQRNREAAEAAGK